MPTTTITELPPERISVTRELLDHHGAELKRQAYDIVATRQREQLTLDVSAVGYLDTDALGVLVTIRKHAEGIAIVLAGVTPEQRDVLEKTGIAQYFGFAA